MNFFQYFSPSNLPPRAAGKDTLAVQREIILQRILNTLLAVYTIGFPIVLLFWADSIRSGQTFIYVLVYAALGAITIQRNIAYTIRASLVVLTLQALGGMALVSYGLSGTGFIFLFGASVVANILFSGKIGSAYTYLSFLIIAVIGSLLVTGAAPLSPAESLANSSSATQWIIAGIVFLVFIYLAMQVIGAVFQGIDAQIIAQESLARRLAEEQASLERRVEARALDLKKRLAQFEIASQIAKEISQESDLESLLNKAVQLIRDRFEFYHVGVFVVDGSQQFAVLRAATGEAGRLMLERNHRLKIGEVGMVGYVVSRGEARIALDVSEDPAHYKNPLLPETRSEMALPLRLGEVTIGALDVQSVVSDAFVPEDAEILHIIADQLAIAFDQARLVDQLRRSLEELETSQGAAVQQAWREHVKNNRQKYAYRYQNSQLETEVEASDTAREAYNRGTSVMKTISGPAENQKASTVLAVPIKLRNQVLGTLDILFEGANISPDLVSLIEGTVNRLAVSLENVRLLEAIQMRAERERLVSEVASKVRTATDVDSVLQIAAQEIGRSLGISEVTVQLRKDAEPRAEVAR